MTTTNVETSSCGGVQVEITGEVCQGQQETGDWIKERPTIYERHFGAPIYPGSLNVCVDEPLGLFNRDIWLHWSQYESGTNEDHKVACTVNGVPAFIVREEREAPMDVAAGRTPVRTMIEILSPEQIPDASPGARVAISY
jgi:CTP-dependent riboflavin kinase